MIKKALKKTVEFLKKETNLNSRIWYVWLTLVLAVAGVIISSYTLIIPVSEIQKDIGDLQYDFPKVFNEQAIPTEEISGGELVRKYFEFLNSGDYQNACSLLSTQMCTLYDVNKFTEWVNGKNRYMTVKLRDGEKLDKVWFSGEILANTNSEIWCGETFFQMNGEEETISQIWQYTIADRPDGNKEIRKSLCEYATKRYEDRSAQMECEVEPKVCLYSKPE